VHDYVAGKADWFAAGLPREGERASIARAGDAVRRDVATCRLGDRVGDVARRLRATGARGCFVTTEDGVLLGRLPEQQLDGDPDATAETVMTPGPLTIRPDRALDAVRERFRERGVEEVTVTTPDGVLVGVLEIPDVATPPSEADDASCDCGA
jgi:Mg/Co/Ni transporter MgtE